MKESDFQKTVIDMAHRFGWRVAHFPTMQNAGGRWMTPKQGDSKGFLDLVLCRERTMFSELKGERGKLSAEQEEWVAALIAAGQEVYVWYPRDLDLIAETLRRRAA